MKKSSLFALVTGSAAAFFSIYILKESAHVFWYYVVQLSISITLLLIYHKFCKDG